jgi:cell filamentation protein
VLDKYGVGNDSYCHKNSDVLINLFDIRDGELLHEAEREISNVNADTIEFSPPPYE